MALPSAFLPPMVTTTGQTVGGKTYAGNVFGPLVSAGQTLNATAKRLGLKMVVTPTGAPQGTNDNGYIENERSSGRTFNGDLGLPQTPEQLGEQIRAGIEGALGGGMQGAQARALASDIGQRIAFGVVGIICITVAIIFIAAPAADKTLDVVTKLHVANAAGAVAKRVSRGARRLGTTDPTPSGGGGGDDPRPPVGFFGGGGAGTIEHDVPDRTELPLNTGLQTPEQRERHAKRVKEGRSGGRSASEIFSDPKWKAAKEKKSETPKSETHNSYGIMDKLQAKASENDTPSETTAKAKPLSQPLKPALHERHTEIKRIRFGDKEARHITRKRQPWPDWIFGTPKET